MPKKPPPVHSRFKPGQSGNPLGRPKLPESLSFIREMTVDEIKRTLAKYMRMTRAELQVAIQDAATPAFDLMVASGIAQGIKTGDYSKISFLLDRTIGKPGPAGEYEEDELSKLSTAELVQLVKEKLPEVG